MGRDTRILQRWVSWEAHNLHGDKSRVVSRVAGGIHPRHRRFLSRCVFFNHHTAIERSSTCKTVKARFWPWRRGQSPQEILFCSLFARQRQPGVRPRLNVSCRRGICRYSTYKTNKAQRGVYREAGHGNDGTLSKVDVFDSMVSYPEAGLSKGTARI